MPDNFVTRDQLDEALATLAAGLKRSMNPATSRDDSKVLFGTVISVRDEPGRPLYAGVQLDGDEPGNIRVVPCLIPNIVAGLRASIHIDPPHQMYVTAILGPGGGPIQSGGRTLTVAASDSVVADKLSADYICSGANDHDTINDAFKALPGVGGRIFLCSGTYDIRGPILVKSYQETPASDSVELSGAGSSTVLKFDYTAPYQYAVLTLAPAGKTGFQAVKNLMIRGALDTQYDTDTASSVMGISVEGTQQVEISGCWFYGIPIVGVGIQAGTARTRLVNSAFWFCGGRSVALNNYPIANNDPASKYSFRSAVIDIGRQSVIANNTFINNRMENIALFGDNAVVSGNALANGAYGAGASYVRDASSGAAISANSMTSGGPAYYGRAADSAVLNGNTITLCGDALYNASIILESCSAVLISGNCTGAILTVACIQCHISSNLIRAIPLIDPATTYESLVLIRSGSANISLLANKFAALGHLPHSAAHIYSDANDNYLGTNDMAGQYTVVAIRNDGPGSNLFGNRT